MACMATGIFGYKVLQLISLYPSESSDVRKQIFHMSPVCASASGTLYIGPHERLSFRADSTPFLMLIATVRGLLCASKLSLLAAVCCLKFPCAMFLLTA